MPLWADAIIIMVLALLIDRFIGELPNRFHPLRWMGNVLGWIDRRLRKRKGLWAVSLGFLSYMLILSIFGWVALLLTACLRTYVPEPYGEILWIVATAFIVKMSFAVFSFRKHCDPIRKDLDEGKVAEAASKVQMIVSRNTLGMDSEHISSSCCETVSENYADSVCSPMFFTGLLGLPGAFIFRCANLMDAMWGYKNEKYGDLGHFPARLDDVLGFLTSRMSILFITLGAMFLGMSWRDSIPAARREHRLTPSPNSGWPMTATSAALGISMEKKDVYIMNPGKPLPTTEDVRRCLRLIELSSVLFLIIVTVPLFTFAGIHIQIMAEDLIVRGIEWISGMIL
jgi:adenosylcobinamide-phosphate synthase